MKKIIALILAVIMSMFCLISCENGDQGTNTDNPQEAPKEKTLYDKLDDMMKVEYDNLNLKVSTQIGDETLVGDYKIFLNDDYDYEVTYKYELLNKFEGSVDNLTVPKERKTTYKGTIKMYGNEITQMEGANLILAVEELKTDRFSFKEANFEDVKTEDGKFSAKIKDFKGFMGIDQTDAKDATVTVTYSEALTSIVVKYNTTDAKITMSYTF